MTLSVASARELPTLLDGDLDVDSALAAGLVTRVKLRGRWVYLASETSIEDALDIALAATERYLEEWLLAHKPYLLGGVCKLDEAQAIGKGAMDLLIQELTFERRLGGLPLLTSSYQPLIAFHCRSDGEEIARQVEALMRQLQAAGRVDRSDLPPPARNVPRRVWRDVVLKHGEWRGLGWLEDGELVAWG